MYKTSHGSEVSLERSSADDSLPVIAHASRDFVSIRLPVGIFRYVLSIHYFSSVADTTLVNQCQAEI